jgi:hypothetical protein
LATPSEDRLAQAARRACSTGAGHRPLPVGTPRPIDPALLALATLLGSAAPPVQPPSLGQQVAGRLASFIQLTSARLAALVARDGAVRGGGDAAVLTDARGADAPAASAAPPRAPQQPPPPSLTIHPTLGTIVSTDPAGPTPFGATPGSGDGRTPLLPSSWVPVLGPFGRIGDQGRAGVLRLVARLDEWLDSVGLNRLHLLVLTLAAPAAVTFLIAVVAALLGE